MTEDRPDGEAVSGDAAGSTGEGEREPHSDVTTEGPARADSVSGGTDDPQGADGPGDTAPVSALDSLRSATRSALDDLRSNRRKGLAVTAAGALVGLALVPVHWAGLIVGGALVALPARSLPRGLLAGLCFGLLIVGAFLVVLVAEGLAGSAVATGLPFGVATAIAVGGALLGSLVRGIV